MKKFTILLEPSTNDSELLHLIEECGNILPTFNAYDANVIFLLAKHTARFISISGISEAFANNKKIVLVMNTTKGDIAKFGDTQEEAQAYYESDMEHTVSQLKSRYDKYKQNLEFYTLLSNCDSTFFDDNLELLTFIQSL